MIIKKAFQTSVIMISAVAAALSISDSHDNKTDQSLFDMIGWPSDLLEAIKVAQHLQAISSTIH